MDMIIGSLTSYLIIAIPLSILAMGGIYLLKKCKISRIAKLVILSLTLFIIFTPMMGGGGASLATFPYPAIGKMFDFDKLSWHFESWPTFTVLSLISTLLISILISIKLFPNKSLSHIGEKEAPPG